MSNSLKLIRVRPLGRLEIEDNVPYIPNTNDYGEDEICPAVLAYRRGSTVTILDKGGSPRNRLIKCSDLKRILDNHMFKGTKFISSTFDPSLYYLIPGNSDNDSLSNSDNDFIPTLNTAELSRGEVDGFSPEFISRIDDYNAQDSVRSIKFCDNWNSNPVELEEISELIDERIDQIFGVYKGFDAGKITNLEGGYSVDPFSRSSVNLQSIESNGGFHVFSLLSESSYTDTINLNDWIYKSGNGTNVVFGKLDVSYMYSLGTSSMYGGMVTLTAFRYEGLNKIVEDDIFDLGKVQIEYMGGILKIFPEE